MGGLVRWLMIIGLVVAAALIIAGFAVVYWPAALIATGFMIGIVCLYVDIESDRGDTR